VQEFQAGERSEGRHLYQLARDYANRTGDADYLAAIRLFIAEEQRHARDLARFLALHGIPVIDTTFSDRVFRRLRNVVPSLEISIAVLVTAEIIAKVYYAALQQATRSVVLRRLCDQILSDERGHVEFQSEQLRRLRAGRSPALMAVTLAAQRLLFAGTVLVVAATHRPVIRRGGLTPRTWWAWCWREFEAAATVQSPSAGIAVAEEVKIGT
jgi:rubrerythrin